MWLGDMIANSHKVIAYRHSNEGGCPVPLFSTDENNCKLDKWTK